MCVSIYMVYSCITENSVHYLNEAEPEPIMRRTTSDEYSRVGMSQRTVHTTVPTVPRSCTTAAAAASENRAVPSLGLQVSEILLCINDY